MAGEAAKLIKNVLQMYQQKKLKSKLLKEIEY